VWKSDSGAPVVEDGVAGATHHAEPLLDPDSNENPFEALLAQKKRLEELNGWFDIALNNMVRGLSMFDGEQRLIVCNNSYREMYNLPEELTRPSTPLSDIVRYHVERETGRYGPNEAARQTEWLTRHVAQLSVGRSFSHVQDLRDGRKFLVTYQPLANGGWVDIQEDITEKSRTEQHIEWLARHDALTGVANRFHFRETFEAALRDTRDGGELALHWLDLDRFKEVNDTFGHPVGDALLKAVAKRLQTSIRKSDFLARLGGDEFAIIQFGGEPGSDQCVRLAQRVLNAVSRPYLVLGHALSVGVSIGIVRAPEHGTLADDLLKKADVALYNVKSCGRQSYEVYRSGSGERVEGMRRLESDMHSALSRNQFELHYQPILCLKQQRVAACEALLRWRHPDHGVIAPDEFLPIADRTGEIVDVGAWVLEQACRDAAAWPDALKVSVNISARQLECGDLPGVVSRALAGSGLDAKRLELEISEAALNCAGPALKDSLEHLRSLGVGIALDDFGRSQGSLCQLQSFSFDRVKIDRTLVRDLPVRAESEAMVRAVVALARTLGMLSVAEGIETRDELEVATRIGFGSVQGYFFSRPVPVSDLASVLSGCPQKFPVAA
jgi:diguanylate cyclase (GGDEF)-like protein